MSRKLTASDRYTLIKLASTMAVGSPERKAVLAGLKVAGADRYDTPEMDAALETLSAASPRILKWLNENTEIHWWKPRYSGGASRGASLYYGGLGASQTYTAEWSSNRLGGGKGWWIVDVYLSAEDGKVYATIKGPNSDRESTVAAEMDASVLRSPGKLFARAALPGSKYESKVMRRRYASVTLADRMKHDKQTAKMIGRILDRTVDEWEKATSTLYLNDLSKAYRQIDDFESIANRMKSRLGDLWASHIDGHGMADFYDEVTDSGHYDLIEAYESAQQELQDMVDHGMADDGYEDAVQERVEEDVLPVLEDAIAQFQRDHDVSKYRVDYRRHEKEEAAARAHREDVHRQIAEMEAKIKRLRSTL